MTKVRKVPAKIKRAIKSTTNHMKTGWENDAIVREWLKENNLHTSSTLNFFIDTCEFNSGTAESFIEYLEEKAEEGYDEY